MSQSFSRRILPETALVTFSAAQPYAHHYVGSVGETSARYCVGKKIFRKVAPWLSARYSPSEVVKKLRKTFGFSELFAGVDKRAASLQNRGRACRSHDAGQRAGVTMRPPARVMSQRGDAANLVSSVSFQKKRMNFTSLRSCRIQASC